MRKHDISARSHDMHFERCGTASGRLSGATRPWDFGLRRSTSTSGGRCAGFPRAYRIATSEVTRAQVRFVVALAPHGEDAWLLPASLPLQGAVGEDRSRQRCMDVSILSCFAEPLLIFCRSKCSAHTRWSQLVRILGALVVAQAADVDREVVEQPRIYCEALAALALPARGDWTSHGSEMGGVEEVYVGGKGQLGGSTRGINR